MVKIKRLPAFVLHAGNYGIFLLVSLFGVVKTWKKELITKL